MKREELKRFYKEHNLNEDDVFTLKFKGRNTTIITKSGIEKIQYQNIIDVRFDIIECTLDNVVFKARSVKFNETLGEYMTIMETHGSASKNNCTSSFLVEIAEKRALARCIIKTMQWTNCMGRAEVDDQPSETINAIKND